MIKFIRLNKKIKGSYPEHVYVNVNKIVKFEDRNVVLDDGTSVNCEEGVKEIIRHIEASEE